MRRPAAVILVGFAAGLMLTACHTPGGAVRRHVIVEFVTPDSAAAKPVIAAACGRLPGVAVEAGRQADPNLVLDVTHATARQLSGVTGCLSRLQASRSDLRIRSVELDDGLDN